MEKIKTWYEKNLSKVKVNDRVLWKNYLSILGVVSSAVTLLSFFLTAQNIGDVAAIIIIAVTFVAALIILFIIMWWKANHKRTVTLKINKTKVCVQEGDIFSLLDRGVNERAGEVSVVAVNNFYDTIVDNRIIAEKTLHGQYIKRLTADGKLEQLNNVIENDELLNKPENCTEVSNRVKGRKISYSIGSVLEFEGYVLAAFTKFDGDNKAYLSADEYTEFWMKFWENIDGIYAGRTINIPLMGAGITRFKNGKPSKQELLEVMIWTLKISGFHNTYSDKQINIIVYKSDVNDIDFYHTQHNQSFR